MFRWYGPALIIAILSCAACAQSATIPSFETASVKVSQSQIGHEGTFTAGPDRVTARNATLKRLIYEAWQAGYARNRSGQSVRVGVYGRIRHRCRKRHTQSARRNFGRC